MSHLLTTLHPASQQHILKVLRPSDQHTLVTRNHFTLTAPDLTIIQPRVHTTAEMQPPAMPRIVNKPSQKGTSQLELLLVTPAIQIQLFDKLDEIVLVKG